MRAFCTNTPEMSLEKFPAVDEWPFQLPDIPNLCDELIEPFDDIFFDGLAQEGSVHSPAPDSSQPDKTADLEAERAKPGERKLCAGGSRKRKAEERGVRVAFKTMSDVEIMEDGYRWRKYGRKLVKESPNPRNYYRCSHGECNVKKRIERDREDPRFVITSYEGVHNHECPSVIYYITPQDTSDSSISSANIPFMTQVAQNRQAYLSSNSKS